MTINQYSRKFKKVLVSSGYIPIKAKFDKGNNCVICGESGMCPGWHIDTNKQNQFAGETRRIEGELRDKLNSTIPFYV